MAVSKAANLKERIYSQAACAVQAFGNAAMILASGKKGNRFALPHSRIMTAPPRINRSFGSTSNIMIKANELEYNTQTYVDFLSDYTGGRQTSLCSATAGIVLQMYAQK